MASGSSSSLVNEPGQQLFDRGLNLLDLATTTADEIFAFRQFYANRFGYSLPAFELWLENRPDVLKAYRLQAQQSTSAPWTALTMLHVYAIAGYEDGILYEIRNCQAFGLSREELFEVLAVAFLHAGPRGMRFVYTAAGDYLREYQETGRQAAFPTNWAPDPDAFRSGLDYSTVELGLDEESSLFDWYMRNVGEVPSTVTWLARNKPTVLKAYRRRWETAIRRLPKQMMPVLMLQFNVSRGLREGVHEAISLGRAWGMTSEQLIDAIVWGMNYHGGLDALYTVADVAPDLIS